MAERRASRDPRELLKWLHNQVLYLEGLSHVMHEEAARQMRRRVQQMYDDVRLYLAQDEEEQS